MDSTRLFRRVPAASAPLALALLTALAGCPEPDVPGCIDADGDGYGHGDYYRGGCTAGDEVDCDDQDQTRNPGAAELCDGIDNNCDGEVDGEHELAWAEYWPDDDGDGFGDPGSQAISACDAQLNHVTNNADCDDADEDSYPQATELCDGIDNDCDGVVPDDEADADGDQYRICDGDCDDTDGAIHPGATEECDGLDNDCDGQAIEDETDDDGDGYAECEDDCDDADPTTYPGASELCDGLDNDCDGTVPADESDGDGDTHRVCDGDCDDTSGTVYPGAQELCDELDNDCDSSLAVDEVDDDGDGFMVCEFDCADDDPASYPGASEQCDGVINDCDEAELPPDEHDDDGDGHRVCEGDCDDGDPTRYPFAAELCDGLDNDCDGAVPADEGDSDGDGYWGCDLDCDDTDPAINPDAYDDPEDMVDQNCDGIVAGAPPTGQIVAHWPFQTDATDVGPNNNHGASYYTSLADGAVGNAMEFDGQDSHIVVSHRTELDLPGDSSILFWIRPDVPPHDNYFQVLAKAYYGVSEGYIVDYMPGGEVRWGWYPMNNLPSQGTLPIRQWHHVALVFDQGYRTIYIDGQPDVTSQDSATLASGNDLWLGAVEGVPHSDWHFDGRLDEVILYGEALDATSIADYVDALRWDEDGDGWSNLDGDCDDDDPLLHPGDTDMDGVSACDGDCDDVDPTVSYICEIPEMRIPAGYEGPFTMGEDDHFEGYRPDEAEHTVTLTHDFTLGVTEVTRRQFRDLADGWNPGCPGPNDPGCDDDDPVWNVSWRDVAALANLASVEAGLDPCYVIDDIFCEDGSGPVLAPLDCMNSLQGGINSATVYLTPGYTTPYECEGYRLPMEAEWEFAARGGLQGTSFPNGGHLTAGTSQDCSYLTLQLDDSSYLADVAWYCGTQTSSPQAAGGLQDNGYGLFDMSGNVFEWCYDGYEVTLTDETDPVGVGAQAVYRGGGYTSYPDEIRVGYRASRNRGQRDVDLGCRLARTIDP